jgi:hypothetical protein
LQNRQERSQPVTGKGNGRDEGKRDIQERDEENLQNWAREGRGKRPEEKGEKSKMIGERG